MEEDENKRYIGRTVRAVGRTSTEAASPKIKEVALAVLKSYKDRKVPLRFIKDEVEKATEEVYSNGSFSGAMRDLVEESDGRIVNIERGYYIYMGNAKTYEINTAIDKLINDLNDIAVVNLLKAEDEDIEAIRKIPYIQSQLKQLKL